MVQPLSPLYCKGFWGPGKVNFLPAINIQWAVECGSESTPRWIFSHTVSSFFLDPSTKSRCFDIEFSAWIMPSHIILRISKANLPLMPPGYLWFISGVVIFFHLVFFPPPLCLPFRRISLKFVWISSCKLFSKTGYHFI